MCITVKLTHPFHPRVYRGAEKPTTRIDSSDPSRKYTMFDQAGHHLFRAPFLYHAARYRIVC